MKIGVKNHKGKNINKINNTQINPADKFCNLVILNIQLYTGLNINAKIIPTIIDSNIGFNKKKDKTIRTPKIIVVTILLK
jgi:hypothetical protein